MKRINDCEGRIGFKTMDAIGKALVTHLHFTEVEEALFRSGKEIVIETFLWINGNVMPWPASPTGNDEKLPLSLKAFIGMAVTTEE